MLNERSYPRLSVPHEAKEDKLIFLAKYLFAVIASSPPTLLNQQIGILTLHSSYGSVKPAHCIMCV
jgi:hypothetical protein